VAVLRYDDPEAGTRSGGSREEDVQAPGPLPLPPLEQLTDLGSESNAGLAGKALDSTRAMVGYFRPILTTRRTLPCLRRRLSVLRPPFVFMRERNPCLFTRFRLRGLYVGFIPASPIHGCTILETSLKR
jgi:hypothetical protein